MTTPDNGVAQVPYDLWVTMVNLVSSVTLPVSQGYVLMENIQRVQLTHPEPPEAASG